MTWRLTAVAAALTLVMPGLASAAGAQPALNPNPPGSTVKLVFIHHSTGGDWLTIGGLRAALNENNYYVVETDYYWGPPDLDVNDGNPVGYHTDPGHWYNWFLGPHRDTYLQALFNTDYGGGNNSIPNPGGEAEIVMFKSCFSSLQVIYGNVGDPPLPKGEPNPLWGRGVCDDPQCSGDQYYTVSNVKGIYRDLLDYFATRQDKMFVLITTPPSAEVNVDPEMAAKLRDINNWLVYHLLDDYPYNNVFVFDYYNVLTSNGGDPNHNDLGAETGNHHRFWKGEIQHVVGVNYNFSAYPGPGGDNHPTAAGHQKATGEFVDLLNIAYHCWKGDGGCPMYMGRSPLSGQPPSGQPPSGQPPSQQPPSQQPPSQQPPSQQPPSGQPPSQQPPGGGERETGLPGGALIYAIAGAGVVAAAAALYVRRRGRPPARPPAMISGEKEEKLRKLDQALAEGRISEETYRELKKRILEGG